MIYNKNIILEVFNMPKYKLSPEERAAEKETKENLRNIMKELDVKSFDDLKDVFKLMVGEMLENGLEGELDDELGYTKYDYRNKSSENSRNGYSKKTLKTSFGETEIKVPRDRDGEFEPQLVKKNQTTLTGDIEEKILSMYAKGMTTSDIETHIQDIYGLECSDSTISRITDKILPVVREWQSRPLEEVYAVVFMDAIHFHVRSEGQIVKKAVYIAIGINMDGLKEVLGMWVGENESAKFWLSVVNGLRNRGLQDILIACVDGLTGFPAAIEAVYPKTEIQQCIIHQIRNTTKFVSYKDIKALMADLKKVYAAIDEQTALSELENFDEKWGNKYPKIAISWREKWANLSTYFKYPQEVRTLIYTTNAIEGFNRQLRKVTKNKGVFPTDDSLLKMLYLAMMDITKKWTGKRREWGQIHSQLEIFFADRLSH
jgi:transposase-like protein